jgi:hypothetical protein
MTIPLRRLRASDARGIAQEPAFNARRFFLVFLTQEVEIDGLESRSMIQTRHAQPGVKGSS